MRPVPRYATALVAAVALLAAVIAWLRPADFRATLAFADVQEAVRQVETVIADVHHPQCPHQDFRLFLRRQSNRVRMEWSNGFVMIRDGKEGKALALNPESKTAMLTRGPADAASFGELFNKLLNIEQDAAKRLGEQTFDGRKLVGFELRPLESQRSDMKHRVWVDPQTRLPVRNEYVPLDPDNPRTASLHKIATFTFNRPLDESLFSMEPPDGYTLSGAAPFEMPSPPPPEEPALASPVISPGAGIGEARFGMSAEEVMKVLGKPQRIQEYRRLKPEEERAIQEVLKKAEEENLDESQKNRLLNEARKKSYPTTREPDGVRLEYSDRGFVLNVERDRGVLGVECYAWHPGMRPFSGKTDRGIGMGASIEEIEKAYGPPDVKREAEAGACFLLYRRLGLDFQTVGGKVSFITARATGN